MTSVQQRGERFGHGGALYGPVFADVQLLEEPLVDLPLHVVRRGEVGPLAVACGYQGSAERVFDVGGGYFGHLDLHLGLGQRAG
ncbi:hypothetical protein [Amycolatopsis sp. RTGN1]|uniref:hypothetical protein n=1 Tax=Amycolatopsis ponsaeliensis TaxID=2992142 RepID=UPI00254D39F9|nr:hypothetical protein [Amycolatopsis sp. RTGN1]